MEDKYLEIINAYRESCLMYKEVVQDYKDLNKELKLELERYKDYMQLNSVIIKSLTEMVNKYIKVDNKNDNIR